MRFSLLKMKERYLALFSRYVKNIFGDTKEVADWDNGGIQVTSISKETLSWPEHRKYRHLLMLILTPDLNIILLIIAHSQNRTCFDNVNIAPVSLLEGPRPRRVH